VFTWKAGQDPEQFAPLALANMMGGNQLLIGVGWSLVVLLAAWRIRSLRRDPSPDPHLARLAAEAPPAEEGVRLERSHAVEIAFLTLATLYGPTLPLFRTVKPFDAVVFVSIFVVYLVRIASAPAEEPHLVGPAQLVGALPRRRRRQVTAGMFVVAAGVILMCAEPFAEALVDTGREFGVDEFLLVKWLAPLASEAPELLVAALYAWRLNTNAALGTLVSSKVNQWTLLVGSLPVVFMISSGTLHGLPIDALQREELFVTAAQSAFAVAVLANRTLNVREAATMLGLFLTQSVLTGVLPGSIRGEAHIVIGVVYLLLGAAVVLRDRRRVPALLRDGFRTSHDELAEPEPVAG
jgi:cation:H+ antiporter